MREIVCFQRNSRVGQFGRDNLSLLLPIFAAKTLLNTCTCTHWYYNDMPWAVLADYQTFAEDNPTTYISSLVSWAAFKTSSVCLFVLCRFGQGVLSRPRFNFGPFLWQLVKSHFTLWFFAYGLIHVPSDFIRNMGSIGVVGTKCRTFKVWESFSFINIRILGCFSKNSF